MSVDFIKRQAKQASKVLPDFFAQHAPPFSHAVCLDLVSKLHGFPNYHAAQTTESRAEQPKADVVDAHDTVSGPWWCDICGGRINHVDEGYVVFRSEDHAALDFKVIHQRRCDPRGEYTGSMALKDLQGGLGLARLLSFLALGPVMASKESTHLRVRHLEEFVDLVRRMQAPGYEVARRHFGDPMWRDRLSGSNEIAPYIPVKMADMLTWEVSEAPEDAPHLHLVGVRFRGKAWIGHRTGKDEFKVTAHFDRLTLELNRDLVAPSSTLQLALCADGAFRSPFRDHDGNEVGAAVLKLTESTGNDPHTLHGQWLDDDGSYEFTVMLDEVE